MKKEMFSQFKYLILGLLLSCCLTGFLACDDLAKTNENSIEKNIARYAIFQDDWGDVDGVIIPAAQVKAGDLVQVSAKPVVGYETDFLKLNGKLLEKNQFVMPEKTVVVTAKFKRTKFKINLEKPENGQVKMREEAFYHSHVKIETTPDLGYELAGIYVENKLMNGNSFLMPNRDVSVKAVFNKAENYYQIIDEAKAEEERLATEKVAQEEKERLLAEKKAQEEIRRNTPPLIGKREVKVISSRLRDIYGNPVYTGESYKIISRGRDYDHYEKGWLSWQDKFTGDYLYVDPAESKATVVQIYKDEFGEENGHVLEDGCFGFCKMAGKYFNFGVSQMNYVKLKDSRKGTFQFVQQGKKNQVKMIAGTATISYDNFGRPSTGLFDRQNVSKQAVYFNASKVGGLGRMHYDDLWSEISNADYRMVNNYSFKPLERNLDGMGAKGRFFYYNEKGRSEYLIKLYVQATESTQLNLTVNNKTIDLISVTKTEGAKYIELKSCATFFKPGTNRIEVENFYSAKVKISHLEFILLEEYEYYD